jgi:hypothetical protein
MKYTREQIQAASQRLGHKYFSTGILNVNIIGIRNSNTGGRVTNKFDDTMTISYIDSNMEWQYREYDCTTDPGDDHVDNPMMEKGVAILKPGQYPKSHKIRLHAGKYEALGQQNNVKVYRDANKDGVYDYNEDTVEEGIFGINIHRATALSGKTSTYIDKWSAGCQVIASNDDWHEFLNICREARSEWSNNFTYTLIESKDIS